MNDCGRDERKRNYEWDDMRHHTKRGVVRHDCEGVLEGMIANGLLGGMIGNGGIKRHDCE